MKNLILNHLNMIDVACKRGISLQSFEKINSDRRNQLGKLQCNRVLSGKSWNVVLSSNVLIEFVNETILPDTLLDKLFSTSYPLEEVERISLHFDQSQIERIYNEIVEDRKTWSSYERDVISLPNWLVDGIFYFHVYRDRPVNEVSKSIKDIYKSKTNQEKLSKLNVVERIKFIRMGSSSYMSEVSYSKVEKLIFELIPFADLLEDLVRDLGVECITKIFLSLTHHLLNTQDPMLTKNLIKIKDSISSEILKVWFEQLYGEPSNIVLDTEIQRLANNVEHTFSENVYQIIYGERSLYSDVLSDYSAYGPHHLNLIKYCINNNKKAFLRLILTEGPRKLFLEMISSNMLFRSVFRRLVNLNTLNEKSLSVLTSMIAEPGKFKDYYDVSLSFEEFCFLYEKKEKDIRFYFTLFTDFTVGERLRVARELPSLVTVTDVYSNEEDLFAAVRELLKIKPLKQWIHDTGIKLDKASDAHYLKLLLMPPSLLQKHRDSVYSGADVDFILKENELLGTVGNLIEAKIMYIERDTEGQFLLNNLGVTEEFFTKYRNGIVRFADRGLCKVFKTLYTSSDLTKGQRENLILLTKAEISGRLDEVKFVRSDFALEIGMKVSNQVIDEWMNNRLKKITGYKLEETYDYESTIRIGQYPVPTCQHWNNGSYHRCLLSNFDTNKKMIILKNDKGTIVARALIRLTKGSDNYDPSNVSERSKKLRFIDLDAAETTNETNTNEELIMFLENCYTSMDGKHEQRAKAEIIKLALEKSRALGIKLVISGRYKFDSSDYEKRPYHIYISHSKNGYQYLDSLSGQSVSSDEGKYVSCSILYPVRS